MREHIRNLFIAAGLGLLVASGGFAVGLAGAPGAVGAVAPLHAQQTCEQDECNKDCGMFSCEYECVDNTGHNTACQMAKDDTCITCVCGECPPPGG